MGKLKLKHLMTSYCESSVNRFSHFSVLFLLGFVLLGYGSSAPIRMDHVTQQYFDSALAKLKLKLHTTAQKNPVAQRYKRDAETVHTSTGYDSYITGITPVQRISVSHPSELQPFKLNDKWHLAVVNYYDFMTQSFDTFTEIMTWDGSKNGFVKLQSLSTYGATDFLFLEFGTHKYGVAMNHVQNVWYSSSPKFSLYYRIYEYINGWSQPFRIAGQVPTTAGQRIVHYIEGNSLYFVTANSATEVAYAPTLSSFLYQWRYGGAEIKQVFPTVAASDVETFVVERERFLVFAITHDDRGLTDVYSTVYKKIVGSSEPYTVVQHLTTHAAVDVEYFSFQGHHYIAIANEYTQLFTKVGFMSKVVKEYEVDSVIYWWSGSLFVEWQRIPSYGAVSWHFFTSDNNDPFLVLCNSKTSPVIYSYDNQHGIFKPTHIQGLSPVPGNSSTSIEQNARSVRSFQSNGRTFLTVANYNPLYREGWNVFEVTFSKIPVTQLPLTPNDIINNAVEEIENKTRHLMEKTKSLVDEVKQLMTKSGNQTVTGQIRWTNVVVNGNASAANLHWNNTIDHNPVRDNAYKSERLKMELAEQAKRISEIKSLWQKTVFLARNANVTGRKMFTREVNFLKDITVNNVTTSGLLNGINITYANRKLFRTTGDQVISATYTTNSNVTFLDNVDINGTLNGVNIEDDIITLKDDQDILGKNRFLKELNVGSNITLENGVINGIKPSRDVVQRSADWQEILGQKKFIENADIDGSVTVKGLVDGVDLDTYNQTAWKITHPMLISGTKTFINGFKVMENLKVRGKVDGVNVTLLNETAFKRGEDQTVSGFKTFSRGMAIAGHVITESTTNGITLKDNVMTTNTRQIVTANKSFTQIHVDGDVSASSLVDGLSIPFDIALKNKPEIITGKKTFVHDLHSEGDISITGKVDGVKISEWANRCVSLSKDEIVHGSKEFNSGISVKNQTKINGHFNRINLTAIINDVVTLSTKQTIKAKPVFDLVEFNSLVGEGKINEVTPKRDFVALQGEETVSGKMTFLDPIVSKSNFIQAENMTLNDRDFVKFENDAVKKSKKQIITGSKLFHSMEVSRNLTVNGKVNNVTIPEDLVNVHSKQKIIGPLIFTGGLNISGVLTAETIVTEGDVNLVNVSKLSTEAIRLTQKEVTVKGKKTFQPTTVIKNVTSEGKINNVNITFLAESLVSLSKDQTINGVKVFSSDATFERDITANYNVNGINVTLLDEDAVTNNTTQKINGKKTFQRKTNFKKSLLKARPNGISLAFLEENAMSKTKDQSLNGKYKFDNGLTSKKLYVNETLDGVRLDNILLTNSNQTITGKKIFLANVRAMNNVEISGKVNNVDVSILKANVVTLNTDQMLNGSYQFAEDVNFKHNITTDHLVNGIDLSELQNDTANVKHDEVLKGNIYFNGTLYFKSRADFIGALNGINVTQTLSDVVLKSPEQVICAKKIFRNEEGVLIRKRAVSKELSVDGLIDGVNITRLNNTALLKVNAQLITGSYVFTEDVSVNSNVITNSLINGVSVSKQLVTLNGNQTIRSKKCFTNLIADKNVNVTGKVDGVDLSEFDKNRVTLNTKQIIPNAINFKGKVKFHGNVKLGKESKINGIKPFEEIVQTAEEAIINGTKTFLKDVHIRENLNVDGKINNVDINYIDNQTIRLNSSQTLEKDATFTKRIKIKGNIKVDGFVNGHRIRSINNFTEELDSRSNEQLDIFNKSTKSICNKVNSLFDVTGKDTLFHSMKILSEFDIPELGKINSVYARGEVFVTVARRQGSGCGNAYLLRCSSASLTCKISHTFVTNAISMELYLLNGGLFIFVGNKYQFTNSSCKKNPEIYKVNPLTAKVQLYSTVFLANNGSESKASIVTEAEKPDLQSLADSSIILNAQVYLPGKLTDTKDFIAVKQFIIGKQTYIAAAHKLPQFDTVNIFKVMRDYKSYSVHQTILSGIVFHVITTTIFGDSYLGIAGQELGGQPQIRFYKYEAEQGKFISSSLLNIKAESIEVKQIGSVVWLFAAHSRSGIVICKWKGVIGFGSCFLKPMAKIQDVHVIVDKIKSNTIVIGTGMEGLVVMQMKFYGYHKPHKQAKCN